MTATIYGIKTCDTCRKAIKAMPHAQFRDIRAAPLTQEERTEFLAAFGDALINRASTTWRGLDDAAKEQPPQDLLAQHPALMKRPVIRANGALYLGWKADVQKALGIA
ncbi:arsenate reductase-like glutaredoxin family protein [Roseinatronobacter thiooxidans]|uniref:Arsenate reductase-like glutaredoxin family protein n=1 Tax=Roseinatronobacter thiooxidans TaxID=121821 RepID=A0A2W7R9T6_9RHOB|nr:ArsC/Spx/MgsR family protein [Roseinatronobacter thiooxidans]PZX47325.1 arsenate reductase-like glutaredoxin family protein [Roseinatronobacter thiooxidans]